MENKVLCSILIKQTTYLIDGKCHDYIRLLMNDFSLASWVAQICLHLERKPIHQCSAHSIKDTVKGLWRHRVKF